MSYTAKISSIHLDILSEIGNIGAGHAATALSTLLDKKIEMKTPSVEVVSFDEMMDLAGGPDYIVACVFLRIEGDAPGSMFFILSLEQAAHFIHLMTGEECSSFSEVTHSELGLSALQELGNILCGSYLSSLSDFTQLHLYPSVPSLAVEMVGAVISFGLLEVSQVSDHAIVINTALLEEDGDNMVSADGRFFLLPDPQSLQIIFTALGVCDNG